MCVCVCVCVCVTNPCSSVLRICDFGLSYQFRPTDTPKKKAKPQLITSPVYASPDTGTSLSRRGSIEVQSECSTAYLAPEVLSPLSCFSIVRLGRAEMCQCTDATLHEIQSIFTTPPPPPPPTARSLSTKTNHLPPPPRSPLNPLPPLFL